MPKGVEHYQDSAGWVTTAAVKKAVMPKGVEHIPGLSTAMGAVGA